MGLFRLLCRIAPAVTLSLLSAASLAQKLGSTVELQAYPSTPVPYGQYLSVSPIARFPWSPADCSTMPTYPEMFGTFRIFIDGREMEPPLPESISVAGPCPRTVTSVLLDELGFGDHDVVAEFSGNAKVAGSRSPPIRVSVTPDAAIALSDGGVLKLAASDPKNGVAQGSCTNSFRAGTFGSPGWPAQPPPRATSTTALFQVESSNCDWTGIPSCCSQRGEPIPPLARRVLVERDIALPSGTIAWAYGPTPEDASNHWYELPTSTSGRAAYFLVTDGGNGDVSTARDGSISAVIALAVPAYSAVPGRFQDLWWAGPKENGWGLSITQHRDILFGELFIYDAQGKPRWLAMPSGQWNAARTAYTGNVYRPRGTPFNETYDASKFAIGPSIGTLTLIPISADSIRLDYVLDGFRGSKQLSRMAFGPPSAIPQLPLDDLWWGGISQNGWGVIVAQQYRSFFTLWYTYDEKGDATWFVAPSSSQLIPHWGPSPYIYGADLYRPSGSPWIGATYDPGRHAMEKVGAIRMSLGVRGPTMSVQVGDFNGWSTISRVPF